MTLADSSPDAPAESTTDHRVALVTGASSGIGLATARRLHRDGARVAISARDPDRLRLAAGQQITVGGGLS